MTGKQQARAGAVANGLSTDQAAPQIYEIRVEAQLESARWSRWFDGMAVHAAEDDTTVISGVVADQAALHGLLAKVRDLGLPLIALQRVGSDGDAERP
jgi:hypothetical protein